VPEEFAAAYRAAYERALAQQSAQTHRKVEDDYRALSRELTLEEWRQRSAWQRYLDNTMRLTAALQ